MMFTKVSSYLFILLILLQAYQSFASPEASSSTEKKASDIFLKFVTENIDDIDTEDMDYINNNWVIDLEKNVQEWSPSDANTFLSFLQKLKMEIGNILKLLQATDYLEAVSKIKI